LIFNVDEINQKILEASKGSKFYDNEKRNDERTTKQVEEMLKKRDEKLNITPPGSEAWKALEKKIDERAMQLEASRDLSRIILHADMDMFYAAVELKRDPSLLGKAFGVGSGVLVTASYEARKYGCRSGMASHVALKLCPHLIIVKNDMPSYVAASQVVMAVFEEYDPSYAQMSLDEAYLDVTPYCELNQISVTEVVKQLQEEVHRATGLTVSVGIAPNKMLAKISSDRNKPNGFFQVLPDRGFIINLMQDLDCRKIPGIGRVNERLLSSLGVKQCGDIWSNRVMLSLVMNDIDWLLNAYLGIHSNVVEPAKRGERRSVGREHTFTPTADVALLKDYLKQSATQVGKDLERLDYRGKTVTLTFKTDTFRRYTRAKTMQWYQYKGEDLYATACKLLDQEYVARGGPIKLRLIGVRLSGLKDMRGPAKGSIKGMFDRSSKSPQKKKEQDRKRIRDCTRKRKRRDCQSRSRLNESSE
jgi:DNA polymerase kappa